MQGVSQSAESAWYFARIYSRTPFSNVVNTDLQKLSEHPNGIDSQLGRRECRNPKKCFTGKAFNRLPLFLAVSAAKLTSAWMREEQWRKMTRCAVWREMSFMDYNTANGVIIYGHRILLFLSSALSSLRSPYFTLLFTYIAVIILCVPSPSHSFWYSTVFTIRQLCV